MLPLVLVLLSLASAGQDPRARLREIADGYDARDRAATLALVEPLAADATLAPADRAEALRIKGNALVALGKNEPAAAALEEALAIFQRLDDGRQVARVRLALAASLRSRGRVPDALEQARSAEQILVRLGDERLLLDCLAAQLYYREDNDPEFDAIGARALELAVKLGATGTRGRIHHALADRLFNQGKYADAIRELERGVTLLREAGPSENGALGRALTSLGRVQRAHGLPGKALASYRDAIVVQERSKDGLGVVQSWNAMGVAWAAMARHDRALECYERGLAKARELNETRAILFMEGAVATALVDTKRFATAIPILERLIAQGLDPYVARFRYATLAEAYLAVNRPKDAIAAVDSALALDDRTMPDALAGFYFRRARGHEALGDADAAIADARRSLDAYERMRQSLVPLDFVKRGYSDLFQDVFDFAIGVLERQGRHADALATAEEARGRALADLIASRAETGAVPGSGDAAGDSAARLLTGGSTGPDSAPPGLDSPVATRALGATELAALAREHDTTILSYWIGPARGFVWMIGPDGGIASAPLRVTRSRVATLVERLSKPPMLALDGAANTKADAAERAARSLHAALIAPIASRLPAAGATLTVIPHGPLFSMSFSSLRDARGRYLVERYALHHVPSGAVLALAASRPRPTADRWLLVGDPQPRPREASSLPALPAAREEVASIAAAASGAHVERLLGRNATERAVRDALAAARVIHVAAHAVVPARNPSGAFLALGAERPAGADGDGRLTTAEVYGMRVAAELVVLSACRSGRGRVTGDGVAGFSRAFISAGARSVVASLWDVPDEISRRMMARFYRAIGAGRRPAEALREAQVAVLGDLRRGRVRAPTPAGDIVLPPHPALWAGFSVNGLP